METIMCSIAILNSVVIIGIIIYYLTTYKNNGKSN